jgi:tetratricopeptide (TPR) repeat protein
MSNQGHFVTKQVRTLVEDVRARVIRGHYDFDRDLRDLEKHRGQAQTLGDPALEERAVNTIALLHIFSGHFNMAVEQLWHGYELCHRANDVSGMAGSLNSLAVVHDMMGHHTESIDLYDKGLQLAVDYADRVPKHEIGSYGLLLTGKLTTLVSLGRYDEAAHLFDEVWEIADELVAVDRQAYARVMIYGYRGKAALDLKQGQVEEAKSALGLALELARSLDLPFELAQVHFGQAHVALIGEGDAEGAEEFWREAEAILLATPVPVNTSYKLASEARYLYHAGYHDKAQYFARKAIGLLEHIRTPEVEQIIQALSPIAND